MNTEDFAVHRVEGLLHESALLKPDIDKNDRTPFTDGHVDIYSSTSFTKENHQGRVFVQVKGRGVNKDYKPKEIESYLVSRADLEGYLRHKGIVFFLVLINKKRTNKRTAYYSPLTPFKIQALLESMEHHQAKVTLHLRKFPKAAKKMESVFGFADQAQNESPELGFDPTLFESAKEITIYSDSKVDLGRPLTLNYKKLNFSMVLKTEGGMKIPVPGEMVIYPSDYVERQVRAKIEAGRFSFGSPSMRRIDDWRGEIKPSQGLSLVVPFGEEGTEGEIKLTLRDSLGGRRDDIGFYLACVDEGCYSIDGRLYKFEASALEPGPQLRGHFDKLDKICELMVTLDADPYLVSVSEMSDKQWRQLGGLYRAVVEGHHMPSSDKPGRMTQPIGKSFIEVICLESDTPEVVEYRSLFAERMGRQLFSIREEEEGGQSIVRLTPYDILDKDMLLTTINLNLERITHAYDELSEYPGTQIRANHMVLKLINAADSVDGRREEFLSAAQDLNDWLIGTDGALPHHQINRWQIYARRDQLTDDHTRVIRALRKSAIRDEIPSPLQIAFSCSILLADTGEADELYAEMTENMQDTLKEWPIWSLYAPGRDIVRH